MDLPRSDLRANDHLSFLGCEWYVAGYRLSVSGALHGLWVFIVNGFWLADRLVTPVQRGRFLGGHIVELNLLILVFKYTVHLFHQCWLLLLLLRLLSTSL